MREKTKGFVTIAVGDYRYYQMALNLLLSYRRFCIDPMPFAIIADCKNTFKVSIKTFIFSPEKLQFIRIKRKVNKEFRGNSMHKLSFTVIVI